MIILVNFRKILISRYTSVSRSNPYYYSYDYGFVHVIHFTTEFYFYPEYFSEKMIADQYNFIKNDLIKANKNRKNVPWLMTTGHRPMYCEVKKIFFSKIFKNSR